MGAYPQGKPVLPTAAKLQPEYNSKFTNSGSVVVVGDDLRKYLKAIVIPGHAKRINTFSAND